MLQQKSKGSIKGEEMSRERLQDSTVLGCNINSKDSQKSPAELWTISIAMGMLWYENHI